MNLLSELNNICKGLKVNEPMSEHTSMKVGGLAKFFAVVDDVNMLDSIIKYAIKNEINYYIIGKGSNLLVSDRGFDGLIIKLGRYFSNIEPYDNDRIACGSMASMSNIVAFTIENELSGFEGLGGIPGSMGGAIYMNAGAYNYETKDICEYVEAYNSEKGVYKIYNNDLKFGYRYSYFKENNDIILRAFLKLKKGNKEEIRDKFAEFQRRRASSQPLEYPSCGSTFKRPVGNFAGKLIESSNLVGTRVGGAMVSTKHAGFIINYDNASANDILRLIRIVQEKVNEIHGVKLEPEVIMLGVFDI